MQLFTAGPAQTPQQFLNLLSTPTLHHRSQDFQILFENCHQLLKQILDFPHVFSLCCSGSGAMESAICSFAPKKILILNHGKFSKRWLQITQSFQIQSIDYQVPQDEIHQIPQILDYLELGVDCVCLQSVESSSGTRQNFEKITQVIKDYDSSILTIIDGIASFCIEPIQTKNIDVFIASSQKALMLPAGLGFVFLSDFAYDKLSHTQPQSFYLSLQNYLKQPIAFSLPSHLFIALKASLEFYLSNLPLQYQTIQNRFTILQNLFAHHAISLYSKYPSLGIIAFNDSQGEFREKLKQNGILISNGQGELKNQISRIGNFGLLQDFELLLKYLKRTLQTL